jgi:hypothetical protein
VGTGGVLDRGRNALSPCKGVGWGVRALGNSKDCMARLRCEKAEQAAQAAVSPPPPPVYLPVQALFGELSLDVMVLTVLYSLAGGWRVRRFVWHARSEVQQCL